MQTLSLISRRTDLSRQAFRAYYEETHCWLAMRFFPLSRYERNYILDAPTEFDCISVFKTDMDPGAHDLMASGSRRRVMADELEFMDPDKIRIIAFNEQLLVAPDDGVVEEGMRYRYLFLLDRLANSDQEVTQAVSSWLKQLPGDIRSATIQFLHRAHEQGLSADALLWLELMDEQIPSGCPFARQCLRVATSATPYAVLRDRFERFEP